MQLSQYVADKDNILQVISNDFMKHVSEPICDEELMRRKVENLLASNGYKELTSRGRTVKYNAKLDT